MNQEFPLWFLVKLRMDIGGRHSSYNPSLKKNLVKDRTWYQCYKNNRDKLLYRHGYRKRKGQEVKSNWDRAIDYQRLKLIRLLSDEHGWKIVITKILDKMNNIKYNKIEPVDILWKYVVVSESKKINRYYSKTGLASAKLPSWNYFLKREKKRLFRGFTVLENIRGNSWRINIVWNKSSLQTIHHKNSWSYRINEEYKRIRMNNI